MVKGAVLFAFASSVTLAQEAAKPTPPTVAKPTKLKKVCRPAIETGSIISRPRCHMVPEKDGANSEKNGNDGPSSDAPTSTPPLQLDVGGMGSTNNQ